MSAVILVPVKDPGIAKTRLAPALTPRERARIAGAMLDDLVRALQPLNTRVVFVTASRQAADVATGLGWEVLWEARQINESASVDEASRRLAADGAEAVLRLPADIPLATPEDVKMLLDREAGPGSAILVPSWDRMGTNAVLRKPPDLFPSRFGHNSFVLHTQEALRARARLEVVELPRLALDVDAPVDVLRFLEQESDSAARRLLLELNVVKRLK